jgi:stearoyl-CoA desaturase (delta-9 desaturase)
MEKPDYSLKNLETRNVLFFLLTPIIGLALLYAHIKWEGMNYYLLIPAVIMYVLIMLSITGGYHRLFAHRSYRANRFVKLFYLIFGAAAFQESALKWATDHRRHHQKVDSDEDPYTITKGFFFAHIGWIFTKEEEKYHDYYEKDLSKDPLVYWQYQNFIKIGSVVGFIIPLLIGALMGSPIGGLAIVGVLRLVCLHHATFLINSACHYWGTQPYNDRNTAKDSRIMAVLTMGEGYHNFHHHFQADYRNGIRWNHWDPTKWLIQFFHKLGFVDKLVVTPDLEITKALLRMDKVKLEKSLTVKKRKDIFKEKLEQIKGRGIDLAHYNFPTLEDMKESVQKAQKRLQVLKAEYQSLKQESIANKKVQIKELKLNIKMAKIELNNCYAQWKCYIKAYAQFA